MMAAMTVKGAAVLVTGASSGIGAATARMLAERGATVAIVARRADRLEEVLADCRRDAPDSAMWAVDLGDLDAAERVALEAWDRFGRLDALINNHAMPKRRHASAITAAEVEEVLRVNFLAPVRMTLAVLPRMLERNAGAIVNVSSMGGRLGIINETAYCASKFALTGWSEALAVDLHGTGVKVRLVNPGPIDTEIWDRPDNEKARYEGPKYPPAIVAEAIIDAIEGEGFERYVPDLKAVVEAKTSNIDAFITGMAGTGER